LVWDGTVAAQKVLSAALRTGQRFGAGHLIDVLRGKSTDKVRQFGHDRLPTFAVGAEMDDMGWRSVFRQLLAAGVLEADASAYGALKLTDSARPILKGEISLKLRRRVERPKGREARSRVASGSASSAPGNDSPLFVRLRSWRSEKAREQGVPAYVILHDRALHEIASLLPDSPQALLAVPGIGVAKARRYGDELLALVSGRA
jgi:ATP-dependent DNA helicase RecQ